MSNHLLIPLLRICHFSLSFMIADEDFVDFELLV